MITNRLKNIFVLSIPLFIAHGIEEFLTHFYDIDAQDQAIFGLLSSLSNHGATFVVFQIMLWLLLIVSYLLILSEQWRFRLMFIPGIIFIYELHHLYKAMMIGGYYPGLITALLFPVIGYFYWRELLKARKINYN
jgi:hypothetical protein